MRSGPTGTPRGSRQAHPFARVRPHQNDGRTRGLQATRALRVVRSRLCGAGRAVSPDPGRSSFKAFYVSYAQLMRHAVVSIES